MQSINRVVIVLVGVLYLSLGGLFTGLSLEITVGEVKPLRLNFILGLIGFCLGFGCLIATLTIIVAWFIQKGNCRLGKDTRISLLAKSASLGILGIVVGIHSFTMMSESWPENYPFRCKEGCLREGKCFIPECGAGKATKDCACICPFNYKRTNGTCTECKDTFEGEGCSLCRAPYQGEECDRPAYGWKIAQTGETAASMSLQVELKEGFILRDRSISVQDFPVCKPGRCGFECEFPDASSLDPGGVCTTLDREYTPSSKSCLHHDECASKWCEGRCETRGGRLAGICYRDGDCAPFSKCTRRLCSANPRWSKCECTCTQGFQPGPQGCIPCPGMATRAQTFGRLRSISFPCSESPRPGEEGLRLGQCFLNLQGEAECTCNGGWTGEACQCFPGSTRDLCSECALGWQLNRGQGEGLCEKCPVIVGDSVDRYLACGGFRGECERTRYRTGSPTCRCLWPFARDEQGSCNSCQFPFEPMNGLCYST